MSEFEKIIGYEDIKAELSRFASVLKEPERYAKLGVTTPSGILLYGDPGLGKTLMAKCFIAETGCKVYTLRKEKPNGRSTIYNKMGSRIGEIRPNGHRLEAFDKTGRKIAYWDENNDTTYEPNGRKIDKGNLLIGMFFQG